jgi:hypothetical protein
VTEFEIIAWVIFSSGEIGCDKLHRE